MHSYEQQEKKLSLILKLSPPHQIAALEDFIDDEKDSLAKASPPQSRSYLLDIANAKLRRLINLSEDDSQSCPPTLAAATKNSSPLFSARPTQRKLNFDSQDTDALPPRAPKHAMHRFLSVPASARKTEYSISKPADAEYAAVQPKRVKFAV